MTPRFPTLPAWWRWVAPPALVSLFLLLMACRIQTYAIPHDPAQYIQMARILADEPWSTPLFRDALGFVAPVFPLILAFSIKACGLWAPYWINLLLAIGCVLALARVIRDLVPSDRERGLILLVVVYLLIAGHWQNAYFLFYPFRETLSFFLILAAFACLLSSQNKPSGIRHVAAGCLLVLAVGTREPSICAVPGAVVMVLLAGRHRPDRRPWRSLVLLMAPFVAVVVLALPVVLWTGKGFNVQLSTWMHTLSRQSPATLMNRIADGLHAQWLFLVDEFSVLGLILAAVGIWHWRRLPAALGGLLLTSILFLLFYSHVGEPHRRFFLPVLLFAAPFTGGGLCAVLRGLTRIRTGWKPLSWLDRWAYAACVMLICVGGVRLWVIRHPWGPFVSREEIRALQGTIGELAAEPCAPPDALSRVDPTTLSPACRGLFKERVFEAEKPFLTRFHRNRPDEPLFVVAKNNDVLKAALASHTTARFSVRRTVHDELVRGVPVYYIRPLVRECAFRGRMIPDLGPPVEEFLAQYADLVPILGPHREPMTLTLGDGRYAFYRVRPWSCRQVTMALPPQSDGPSILRIDARTSGCPWPGARQSLRLSINGRVVDEAVGPGANYYAFAHPIDPGATVTLESDQPVPTDFAPCWLSPDHALSLDLGLFAFPIQWSVLQSGWEYDEPYWSCTTGAVLRLPVPGDGPGLLLAELRLRAKTTTREPLSVTLADDTGTILSMVVPSGGSLQHVVAPVRIDPSARFRSLYLHPAGSSPFQLQLDRVRVRFLSADRPVTCDLGKADDDLHLLSGFHQREKDTDGRDWRWTGPRASVSLHFPSVATDWTLNVVFSERRRSPRAKPAHLTWLFNGRPLTAAAVTESTSGWQSAAFHLPASRLDPMSNRLDMVCSPWSPAILDGTADDRQLGIVVDRVEWRPGSDQP